MSVTISFTDRQIGRLRKLLANARPAENQDGILLTSEDHRLLRELFEDLEDIRYIRQGEAEFARGEGRPFADYLRERRQRAAGI